MPNSRNKLGRLIVPAWIAACLTLMLSGCASIDPLVVTRTELQRVPAALLSPCPISDLDKPTYEGAIQLAEARGKELVECNKRLDDIRRWSSQ